MPTSSTPDAGIHSSKAELTEFQCVLAAVAFKAVTEDMNATRMKDRMS